MSNLPHIPRALPILSWMLFLLLSWGTYCLHISTVVHVGSLTGDVVHVSAPQFPAPSSPSLDVQTSHADSACHAIHLAALTSAPVPSAAFLPADPPSIASQDVVFRHLQRVYLSHLALSRAPKTSPPLV